MSVCQPDHSSVCLAPKGSSRKLPLSLPRLSPRHWILLAAALIAPAFAATLIPEAEPLELLTIQKAPFRVQMTTSGSFEPLRTERVQSECQWTVRILSLVPEGTWVKKGDIVCVLDSSEIEEFQRSREVTLIKAAAELQASRQKEELLKTSNERRLAEAQRECLAAELDLLEYSQGLHPNEVQQLDDDISFNHDRLQNVDGNLQFAERLWMLGYANRAEVDSQSLAVTSQLEQLRRLEFKKNLLQDFTHPRRNLQMTHHLNNSQLKVHRTELANSLAVSKAKMGTLLDEHRLAIYERYARSARTSIQACTLRAPRDGQVIHCNNWRLRSRGVITIEEGKSVYFSQPVFEIPDQDHLKISLPLNESLITRVAVGAPITIRPVGLDDVEVPAAISRISPYPVVRNRYSPDIKEYFLEAILEPREEHRELLRPRMEADAVLTLMEKRDAISIPPSAVVRHAGRNIVLMKTGDEFLPCQVQPGEVFDGKVLIESGLHEGDQIVSVITDQHRRVLNEKLTGTADFGE